MRAPALAAVMERRILVNYRVDPDLLGSCLPAPFRPALVAGRRFPAGTAVPDSAFLMSRLTTIWHPQPELRLASRAGSSR